MIWRRHSIDEVKLGNEWHAVHPLSLENALKLALLLAPHAARVEAHWPELKAALARTDGGRPQVLGALFLALREELASMPGDILQAAALLLDKDPLWLAGNMSAQEFVGALPTLDRVNDLKRLWESMKELGLMARYKETRGDSQ